MILVAGATGQLGGLITSSLLARGMPVRALVRDAASSNRLSHAGAEVVFADLKDPDSVNRACLGVDSVVTTANATARGGEDSIESVDMAGNQNLIDQAAAAGVRHFVFVSALGAEPTSPMPLLRAKWQAEERLRASGMDWTVLRPNVFMDKLLAMVVGQPAVSGQVVQLVGDGRRRHSLVAMADVAAFAVAALGAREAHEETLLLGGPRPISWRDAVAVFEAELGHPIDVRTSPPGESVPGLPDFVVGLLSSLDAYDSPLPMDELTARFGVRSTSIEEFARDFLARAENRRPSTAVST